MCVYVLMWMFVYSVCVWWCVRFRSVGRSVVPVCVPSAVPARVVSRQTPTENLTNLTPTVPRRRVAAHTRTRVQAVLAREVCGLETAVVPLGDIVAPEVVRLVLAGEAVVIPYDCDPGLCSWPRCSWSWCP